MSRFDIYDRDSASRVFDMYSDPCQITGGPLNNAKTGSTEAVVDVTSAVDANGAIVYEALTLEYWRADWPYPRRGDRFKVQGKTYECTSVKPGAASALTVTLEVINTDASD